MYIKDKTNDIQKTVAMEDKEAPTIILKGDKEITIYNDEVYNELGYLATDNIDKDITNKVNIEKKYIDNKKYELIYTVADSSGNRASASRIVNLKEKNNENISSNSDVLGKDNGVIYLTFDDGPSLDITPKILDILHDENVKATFFIINYGTDKEHIVQREVNEGHSIGIHGYSHNYKKIYQSEEIYMENLTKLQSKIKDSTSVTTYITRFPGGSSNTVSRYNPKIMTRLTKEVINRGFKYYDWNVGSGDAGDVKTKEGVYNNVTNGIKPNRDNIVLMHDFSGNTKTLNALRDIIRFGKEHGYRFEGIKEDTKMVTHNVNN